MRISVLGPLTIDHADAVITPTAAKPRSVLALLLLHINQTVSVGALSQELWGATPPASAMTTLQTYIVHLRKLLSAAMSLPAAEIAKRVIITAPGGYLFSSATDHFDLHNYEHLASRGQRALAIGDDSQAAELLLHAQQLWRGPALSDVRAGPLIAPQVKRLEESRLATREQCVEARLRLGRHQEVLPELTGLTAEHPLHENLHAQLMVALHRSGRRQEALHAFHTLRATLRGELGLEPSKRLHLLQQAILTDDPALDVAPRQDGLVQLLDQFRATA